MKIRIDKNGDWDREQVRALVKLGIHDFDLDFTQYAEKLIEDSLNVLKENTGNKGVSILSEDYHCKGCGEALLMDQGACFKCGRVDFDN